VPEKNETNKQKLSMQTEEIKSVSKEIQQEKRTENTEQV
jgi:hypothetical protein